jgi:hypothetical protein
MKENTDRPLKGGAKENTTIERHRPPAWDPPNLLLVVGKLVVVSTLGVVVAIVGGAAVTGAPSSDCIKRDMGERKRSNREYSSEVLSKQGSTLHMQHYQRKRLYMWTRLQKCQNREKA